MSRDSLELVFKHGGGVEVRAPTESDHTDVLIWASDNDPDFMDEFPNELLNADESEDILEYLVQEEILTEDEADAIEVFSEGPDDEKDD